MKNSNYVTQVFKKSLVALTILSSANVFAQSEAPAATSTASATTLNPTPVNKIGLTFANQTSNNFSDAKTKGGASTENVISLSYRAQDDLKLAATLVGDYTVVGRGEEQTQKKPTYRDLSLSASTTHGSFLGTEKTPVKYVFNLPTSELSQKEKRAFSIGAEVTLSYPVNSDLTASVLLVPGWILKNGASDEMKNQLNAELRIAHSSKFSSYGFLDHKIKAKTETTVPLIREVASLGVGVSYSPNQIVDLDFSVSRDRELFTAGASKNKTTKFAFLDANEISYAAAAVLKF